MPPSPAPLFSRLRFRLRTCAAVSISTRPSSAAPLRYRRTRLSIPFPLSPPCPRILRAAAAAAVSSSLDLRAIAGGFALFSMAAASSATSVHDFTVKVRKTAQSRVYKIPTPFPFESESQILYTCPRGVKHLHIDPSLIRVLFKFCLTPVSVEDCFVPESLRMCYHTDTVWILFLNDPFFVVDAGC